MTYQNQWLALPSSCMLPVGRNVAEHGSDVAYPAEPELKRRPEEPRSQKGRPSGDMPRASSSWWRTWHRAW